MQEEILGPTLPVLTVENMAEAEAFIRARPKPLAPYLFTRDQKLAERFMRSTPSGGGCVNDTVAQTLSSRLPFGGSAPAAWVNTAGNTPSRRFPMRKPW